MKLISIYVSLLFISVTIKLTAQDSPVFTLGSVSTTTSTVIVPITADDFSNIVSGNLKIMYDTLVTIPVSVTKGPDLAGTFDFNLSDPGIVRIGWFTYPAVTLSNGSVIFNIEFNKVSSGSSVIRFDDGTISIVDCQFYNGSHDKLNDEPFSKYYIPGLLTFNEHAGPVTKAPALKATINENINIPVTVTGFKNVGTVSLKLEYDPSVLAFNSADNTGEFPGMVIENPTPGIITVNGIMNEPNGYNLPDGATLFTLNYKYLGGTTDLKWIDEGKTCEYAGPLSAYVFIDTPQSEYYLDGIVSKLLAPDAPVVILTQPTCEISTGSIEVTSPLGTEYIYSIDGTSYQPSPSFCSLNAGTYNVTAKNDSGYVSFATTVIVKEQPLTPDAPAVNLFHPTCVISTGSIEVTSPLGSEYSYSIDGTNYQSSPGFSDLNAGTYSVTIKNKEECISSATVAVVKEQPLIPDAPAVNITSPTCEVSTGSIEITSPLGSEYSYSIDGTSYQLSPIFHGLDAGSYGVIVRYHEGCTSSVTGVVIEEQPLVPDFPDVNSVEPTCDSPGSASIRNYNAAYTYTFTPSGPVTDAKGNITGLITGQSYTMTAKSTDGCESAASEPFTIQEAPGSPEQPVVEVGAATCDAPGSASINNYNPAYNYNFTPAGPVPDESGNISGFITGQSYTVKCAGTNWCESSTSEPFTVEDILEAPVPTITINKSVEYCESECITLIASEGESYLWSTGETTQSIIAKTTDDYIVEVTYENGCSTLSLPTSIVISKSQQNEGVNLEIKVYPNPFYERVRIEFISPISANACIKIYDMNGRFIKTIFNCDIEAGMFYTADFRPQNHTNITYYYKLTIGSYVCSGIIIYQKE